LNLCYHYYYNKFFFRDNFAHLDAVYYQFYLGPVLGIVLYPLSHVFILIMLVYPEMYHTISEMRKESDWKRKLFLMPLSLRNQSIFILCLIQVCMIIGFIIDLFKVINFIVYLFCLYLSFGLIFLFFNPIVVLWHFILKAEIGDRSLDWKQIATYIFWFLIFCVIVASGASFFILLRVIDQGGRHIWTYFLGSFLMVVALGLLILLVVLLVIAVLIMIQFYRGTNSKFADIGLSLPKRKHTQFVFLCIFVFTPLSLAVCVLGSQYLIGRDWLSMELFIIELPSLMIYTWFVCLVLAFGLMNLKTTKAAFTCGKETR
jgi:hypothetical protein